MTETLRKLRIASPCHVGWDRMKGDERVRFCDSCKLTVYNFSELTSREINELIVKSEGRICARMYRREDGTVLTRDCPVGVRALRIKISRVAATAFATILSACSFVFAQNPKTDKSCQEIPAITLERKKPDNNQVPAFTGTVLDPMGAVIPGATVTLLDASDHKLREVTTNPDGEFSFVGVANGNYSVKVDVPGFKKLLIKKVDLRSAEITTAKLTLNVDATEVVVGLLAVDPGDAVNGTTTIRRDALRKLPIN